MENGRWINIAQFFSLGGYYDCCSSCTHYLFTFQWVLNDLTCLLAADSLRSSQWGFNWIVTAYTLTLTTFVPISGQIADFYGRHTALQSHIFCLMIGSVFCAAAQTWGMLLFGRALQGVGAAGIQNLTRSSREFQKQHRIFSDCWPQLRCWSCDWWLPCGRKLEQGSQR